MSSIVYWIGITYKNNKPTQLSRAYQATKYFMGEPFHDLANLNPKKNYFKLSNHNDKIKVMQALVSAIVNKQIFPSDNSHSNIFFKFSRSTRLASCLLKMKKNIKELELHEKYIYNCFRFLILSKMPE